MIALAIVAIGLVIGYLLNGQTDKNKDKNKDKDKSSLVDEDTLIDQLELEKKEILDSIISLQQQYDCLSVDNDSMSVQIRSSREEVAQLFERLNDADVTNRSLIRKYQKELGTLRSIMKNYIKQIDSLQLEDTNIKERAAAQRETIKKFSQQSKELSKEVEGLSSKVAVGSVIKARGLKLEAFTGADKKSDRSSRVKKMIVSLALVENDLAEKGPVRVYVRVKDPNGLLLTNDSQKTFSVAGGEEMICTASREVDYQGQEEEMVIYVNDIPKFDKGIYTVEAYTSSAKLGEAELLLR